MAHHTLKSSYTKLIDRLNRFPQGAPPSDLLYKILQMLFSEKEAGLVALLPLKPFTIQKASQCWKMDLSSTQKVLDTLAGCAKFYIETKQLEPLRKLFKAYYLQF